MKLTCRLAVSAALLLALGQHAAAQDYMFKQRITGLKAVEWVTTTPSYGDWTSVGEVYGCSNWTPDPGSVAIGHAFTQTATDCKQDQTITVQPREQDVHSGALRNVGSPTTESRSITTTSTRSAVGSLETWVAIAPVYTDWVDTNALYGCSNWTPAGSSKTTSGSFIQSATDCKTDQRHARQDREQETTTLAIRDAGTPVVETRTLTGLSASRTYTVSIGSWTNSGALYGCSNWSPAASTVNQGQTFTQTATDCKQNQTRTRTESFVDHKTGKPVMVPAGNEARTLIGQSSNISAIGTKPLATKVCTTANNSMVTHSSGRYQYVWSGAAIADTSATSVSHGGYLYSVGRQTGSVWTTKFYEICRVPN